MYYEVFIDLGASILHCTFEHNRRGLLAALKKINQFHGVLIGAEIASSRDGLVFVFSKPA